MAHGAVCPVCDATADGEPVERVGEYVMRRCGSCDLVFADPMRPADAEWYDRAYVVRHLAVDDRIRAYYRTAVRLMPRGARVLDVGCGEGVFVDYARARGLEAHGVDFSAGAIAAGRKRYGLETIHVGGPRDLPPGLRDLDGVTMFDVIEHVAAPREFLESATALLRPGGVLVLSTPNRGRWPVREFVDRPPHHLTRWGRESLETLARRAGLADVRVTTTGSWESANLLLGYFVRLACYRALRLEGEFGAARGSGEAEGAGRRRLSPGAAALLLRWGGTLRRLRDAAMWVPAVLLSPVLLPLVRGYSLVLVGRKPG